MLFNNRRIGIPKHKITAKPTSNMQTIALDSTYHFSLLTNPFNKKFFPMVIPTMLSEIASGIIPSKSPFETSLINPVAQHLIKLFEIKTSEKVVAKEFKRIQNSILDHEKISDSVCPAYGIRDMSKFIQLSNEAQIAMSVARAELKAKEFELLTLVNKPPEDSHFAETKKLKEIGQSTPAILDELFQLFFRRDALLFHRRNPGLSPKEIIHLQNLVAEYLEQSTYSQQLDRFIKRMDGIKEAYKNNLPRQEVEELIKQFISQSKVTRAYDTTEHPEYLVLEYYMNILMRPDQVTNLDLLMIKNGMIGHTNTKALGVILEMIMGSGKSTVLFPLIGLANADGEHLSIGSIPEQLLPSVGRM
jgi:hypothetical protein